ncbi:MAG: sigma-54-dependent Fis family transcriptional regulator [Spirochaetales bacterium]|nr:sigma-54-dependent Fis family transcriptional regulator [Spirochaetales bacterium]
MKQYPSKPILIVDDEEYILEGQKSLLMSEGIDNIICLSDSREVQSVMSVRPIELVLLDLMMPELSGQKVLSYITENYPEVPVIIITGVNDIAEAVKCIKAGAFDYMVKVVEKSRLLSGVRRAIEYRSLARENRNLREYLFTSRIKNPGIFSNIITGTTQMSQLFAYIEIIGDSTEPVMITGETGVGKELFARAVYDAGNKKGEYITVNVAGIDDLTFSDTLFGHHKGAYTGASDRRPGLLQLAEGGAILLDEIGDLSNNSQVKLLRLIDKGEYYPLGSDLPKRSNTRIIAVTNRDISKMVRDGRFRKDLFYRLDTHSIVIPPLRDRFEDLPLLVEYFLSNSCPEARLEIVSILRGYSFPGNVRELRSLLIDSEERSLVSGTMAENIRKKLKIKRSSSQEGPAFTAYQNDRSELPTIKEAVELLVQEAMGRAEGNQTLAAGFLGISKQALSKRLLKNNQEVESV